MKLRPYQQQLITDIGSSLKNGHRAIVAVLGCGGGKSIIQGSIAKSASDKGKRVLFLVHRKELCQQITNTFKGLGVDLSLCDISMVQTISRRLDKLPNYDLIITDECFTANTLIDGKPISTIKEGNTVKSYNENKNIIEEKKVTHVFKRKARSLLNVQFSNGKSLTCTFNHPIYVDGYGYKKAIELKEGDYVRSLLLHNVWEVSEFKEPHKKSNPAQTIYLQKDRENLLLQRVWTTLHQYGFKYNNGKYKSKICKPTDKNKQSDATRRNKSKNVTNTKTDRASTENKRRKRERHDCTSRNDVYSINPIESDCGMCRADTKCRHIQDKISNFLQSRYSSARENDCHRNRWFKPLFDNKAITRQEKRFLFDIVRVESVEILQQTSDGTFGGMCANGYVYNLEVEGNHNYFANGILVHNCHHSTANTYLKIYGHYNNAMKLGFTATPIRLNKGGLGEVYTDLITSVSTKWLIENNYLAPYKYYSVKLADTSTLHTVAGEFKQDEVQQLMENKEIYGDTVKQWERLAKGSKTIVYCASVEASKKTSEQFLLHGYSSIAIDGNTPQSERERAMRAFRNGEVRILCNCELFGEGLDVPDCECVVLLRPTQSLTLFIQQSMRSMRYMPNKTAIIIDHVGNCYRHGLPDDDREWSLEPKHKQESIVKIRECKNCFAVYPPNLSKCPYCGAEATHEIRKTDKKVVEVDLVELQRTEEIKSAAYSDLKAETWDDIVKIQKARGYKFWWCFKYAKLHKIAIPKKYYAYMVRNGLW